MPALLAGGALSLWGTYSERTLSCSPILRTVGASEPEGKSHRASARKLFGAVGNNMGLSAPEDCAHQGVLGAAEHSPACVGIGDGVGTAAAIGMLNGFSRLGRLPILHCTCGGQRMPPATTRGHDWLQGKERVGLALAAPVGRGTGRLQPCAPWHSRVGIWASGVWPHTLGQGSATGCIGTMGLWAGAELPGEPFEETACPRDSIWGPAAAARWAGGRPGDKAYMLCGDQKAPIPRLPQNHVGLCSPAQHSHPSLPQTPTGCGVLIAEPEGASPHTVPAGYECPLYLQQCISALCPSEAQSKLCMTQIHGRSLLALLLPSPTCCLLLSPSHQAHQGWAVIGWALLCWVVPPAWSPRHRGSTEGILLQ